MTAPPAPIAAAFSNPTILLTATTLFWAGNAVAGQLAVGEVAPLLLVLLRWIMVSVALWVIFGRQVRAHWATIRPKLRLVVISSALGFTAFNALFYIASHSTSAVNIGIIQGAMPAMVMIGAFAVHGARVTALQAFGVVLTMFGVVLVATKGDPALLLRAAVNHGDALMLLACVFYAGYAVMLKDRPQVPGAVLFTVMAIVAAVAALPFAIAETLISGWQAPTAKGWLVTLYIAIFPSCLSQIFFLKAVDMIGPGRAGVYINLVPIFAAALAVALLGEAFAPYHALALALVIGGIVLAQRTAAG